MAASASTSSARARRRTHLAARPPTATTTTAAALASGLLASSCCVLQLALNAASVGCAGFSALTPYQPLFRALTAASLAALAAKQGIADRRTLVTAAVALALAASSDVLAAVNRGGGGRGGGAGGGVASPVPLLPLLPPLVAAPLRRALVLARGLPPRGALRAYLDASCGGGGGGGEGGGMSALSPPPPPAAASLVKLRVRGVRCEACAARVRGALQAVGGVVNATVDVERGEAAVWFLGADSKDSDGGGEPQQLLVEAVEGLKDGYEVVGVVQEEGRARGGGGDGGGGAAATAAAAAAAARRRDTNHVNAG
jgi:copper chaperone CopZ